MEGGNRFDIAGRAEDDLVRRAGVGAAGPVAGLTITGFLGNSPRDGYRRIYLDRSLERYVEFAVDHILDGREVPAGESPFVGEQATSVRLRPDARVDVARTVSADAFDLQTRLGDALPVAAPGDVLFGPSGRCGSARYRCTRQYCAEADAPEGEFNWPWFRGP